MICPGPFTESVAELEVTLWFPHQGPRHKHKSKYGACKPLWFPQQNANHRWLYNHTLQNEPNSSMLFDRMVTDSKETLNDQIQTSASTSCSTRSLAVLPGQCYHCHFPRVHSMQISLIKFLFFTGEQKPVSWHVASMKLHFSSTVTTFLFYF